MTFEEGKRKRNRGVRAELHDGGVYHGQVRNGRLDGRGHVTYWQGSEDKADTIKSYEGLFCNDRRHGVGVGRWDTPPYETMYAGAWEEGLPNGPGVMVWPDGAEYKGEFSRGVPHGLGVHTMPGAFSLATGERGPDIQDMGFFHCGRLLVGPSAQHVEQALQRPPLAIPPPRPVLLSPTSTRRRTAATARTSAPSSPDSPKSPQVPPVSSPTAHNRSPGPVFGNSSSARDASRAWGECQNAAIG